MTKGKGKTPGVGGLLKHIARRPHKERLQPEERRHLGHLEKHKDYVSRAKLFHTKEDKIRELEKQVSQRNPEEFHFEMIHSSVDHRSGKHIRSVDDKRSTKQQMVLNARDIRYLEFRRNMLRREIATWKGKSCVPMPHASSDVRDAESLHEDDYFSHGSKRTSDDSLCVHTKFVYESDVESGVDKQDACLEASVSDGMVDSAGEEYTSAENQAYLRQTEHLYSRIDRVLQALKLQTNLIKKGRRKKIVLPNGNESYKWLTTRRKN